MNREQIIVSTFLIEEGVSITSLKSQHQLKSFDQSRFSKVAEAELIDVRRVPLRSYDEFLSEQLAQYSSIPHLPSEVGFENTNPQTP